MSEDRDGCVGRRRPSLDRTYSWQSSPNYCCFFKERQVDQYGSLFLMAMLRKKLELGWIVAGQVIAAIKLKAFRPYERHTSTLHRAKSSMKYAVLKKSLNGMLTLP